MIPARLYVNRSLSDHEQRNRMFEGAQYLYSVPVKKGAE